MSESSEGLPCPHCGRIDERHQHERRWLAERVAELETENAMLRASAIAFGELAERLNFRVRHDRRSGLDRREQERTTPDRRVAKPRME